MAVTLYFRPAGTSAAEKWSSGDQLPNLRGTNQGWSRGGLSLSRGGASTNLVTNTIVGPTPGLEVQGSLAFISLPVDRDVTIAGLITANLRSLESSMNANVVLNFVVDKIDGATGAITEIGRSANATEIGTSEAAASISFTPAAGVAVKKGDRLRVRVFGDDGGGNMASGFSFTFFFNGPTAGASGDSFITFTETFSLITADPAGSQLFLTDTDPDVPPQPDELPGLVSWYDFADPSVLYTDTGFTNRVSADGQQIKAVADKSGAGVHLTENNGPIYKTGIQNGKSVSRWNGSTSRLASAVNGSLPGNEPFTFFIVVSRANASMINRMIFGLRDAGGFKFQVVDPTTLIAVGSGNDINSVVSPSGGFPASPLGQAYVFAVQYDGNTKVTIRRDGIPLVSALMPNNASFGNWIEMGCWVGSSFFEGDIAELCLYDRALTPDEITVITEYLERKWGVTDLAAMPSGVAGWYDFGDLSTLFQDNAGATPVTADGQTIGRISDKSGNGRHLTQATAANRPTYKVNRRNGRSAALFDGVNDILAVSWSQAQPWTFVFVLKQTSGNATSHVPVHFGSGRVQQNTGGQDFQWTLGSADVNIGAPLGGWYAVGIVVDGASSFGERDDGSLDLGNSGTNGASIIQFGDGSVTWDSDIGEMIVFNRALSKGELEVVMQILQQRWGIINPRLTREMWTSRGAASSQHRVDTATGWTAPIRMQEWSGAEQKSVWYSKPLQSVTLAGQVLVNLRSAASDAASNANLRAEIAVTDGDGNNAVVWGVSNTDDNITTGEAPFQFWVSGDDLAIANGSRIRLRVFIDDSSGVAMALGKWVGLWYAGPTGGAVGDSYITFPVTLAVSGPQAYSKTATDALGELDPFIRLWTTSKVVADAEGLLDVRVKGFGKSMVDPVGLVDSRAKAYGAPLTDVVGLLDTAPRATTSFRSSVDTIGLLDSQAKGYGQTVVDILGLVDNASRPAAVPWSKTPSDVLGLLDAATRSGVFGRTAIDAVGLLDSVARAAAYTRSRSDAEGLLDVAADIVTYIRPVVDPIGLLDSAIRPGGALSKTPTDPIGLLDATLRSATFIRTPADVVGLLDAVVRLATYTRSRLDTIGLLDASSRLVTYSRLNTDAEGILDAITRAWAAKKAPVDSIGLLDSVVKLNSPQKLVADGVGLLDSITRLSTWQRALMDNVGLLDGAARSSSQLRSRIDALGLLDGTARSAAFKRLPIDPLGILDVASHTMTSALVKSVLDAIGLTDQATRTSVYLRTNADGIGVVDSRTMVFARGLTTTDTVGLLDSSARVAQFVRDMLDLLGITDVEVIDVGLFFKGPAVVVLVPATPSALLKRSWPEAEMTYAVPEGRIRPP